MRLPVKPLCAQKRLKKEGTSPVYLQYCYDAEHKTFLNTDIAIPPQYWDRNKQCIKQNLPAGFGSTEKLNDEIEAMSNVSFNENIKEIAQLAGLAQVIKFSHKKGNKVIEVKKPKYAWVTSHTARRSFCTNEFLAGTPVKLIMLISGHKNEKDFYKYIRISPEEAAHRIKLLWMERDKMQVFADPVKKAINMQIA